MSKELQHLARYFETQKKAFEKLSLDASHDVSARNIHQLRVATRRLKAVLWLLENSTARLRFENLSVRLSKLTKALGKARELDVAIKDAKAYALDPSTLKRKRKKKRIRLCKKLQASRRDKLIKDLTLASKAIHGKKKIEFSQALQVMSSNLRPWVRRRKEGPKRLHQLRIAVKKARYALEASGRPVGRLTDLQSALGRVHDLTVLQELAAKNEKIRRDQRLFGKQATRLAAPTLRTAIRHLNTSPF